MKDSTAASHILPRIDARDEAQRNVADYLRSQHLSGVDTDDDASVVLEIEQARLTLLAAGGAIAFEVTQLLSASKAVCVGPLYWSLFLLCLAMVGAWIALIWSEHIRRFRVDRRYTIFHGELSEYLALDSDAAIDPYSAAVPWWGQITIEKTKRKRLRVFRYLVMIAVAGGIGMGVLSAIGTADLQRCHGEVLKLKAAISRTP